MRGQIPFQQTPEPVGKRMEAQVHRGLRDALNSLLRLQSFWHSFQSDRSPPLQVCRKWSLGVPNLCPSCVTNWSPRPPGAARAAEPLALP